MGLVLDKQHDKNTHRITDEISPQFKSGHQGINYKTDGILKSSTARGEKYIYMVGPPPMYLPFLAFSCGRKLSAAFWLFYFVRETKATHCNQGR